MALIEGTDKTFAIDVEGEDSGKVLVYFWAPWCPPCKVLGPIIQEIDEEIGDKLKIVKINVDDNPESAANFEVMSIPTLIGFHNGEMKSKLIGLQPKEQLIQWLDAM
ncbi:thioredoxin [Shimazuella sp. AN120528]|uniref:thioredoxin n=1 Tax=Shimazuella soli TaxID=1892854 RepID=UPI001F118A44|nr:thioredoxin [Shimazuella soli]MCH5584511.1 thioredoxin [Shimazuella soli]